MIEHNRTLQCDLEAAGIPHVYQEFPLDHCWPYWSEYLADSLRFFGACLAV